jgi:leucyl aminopeptidase (aminopeptidase T)
VISFAAEAFEKKAVPKPVEASMMSADVVLDITSRAPMAGPEITKSGFRYVTLGGYGYPSAELVNRLIGKVDYPTMVELEKRLAKLLKGAKKVRMTNPSGTNVNYELDPHRSVTLLPVYEPAAMIAGLVGWAPVEETVNGTVAVDGCVFRFEPPIEHRDLTTPIELKIEQGKITNIKGDYAAKRLKKWLDSYQDQKMYNVAHFTFGTQPMTSVVRTIETERLFGTTTLGIGWQNPLFEGKAGWAPAHCDAVVLNVSTWLDGVQVQENGNYIHPKVAELSKKLAPSKTILPR